MITAADFLKWCSVFKVQTGGGGSGGNSDLIFVSENVALNATPGTVTELFTLASATFDFFVPKFVSVDTTQAVSVSGATPIISIGSNDPDYDDLLEERALAAGYDTYAGFTSQDFANGVGYDMSGAGTLIKMILNTASTATTHTAKITIGGIGVKIA